MTACNFVVAAGRAQCGAMGACSPTCNSLVAPDSSCRRASPAKRGANLHQKREGTTGHSILRSAHRPRHPAQPEIFLLKRGGMPPRTYLEKLSSKGREWPGLPCPRTGLSKPRSCFGRPRPGRAPERNHQARREARARPLLLPLRELATYGSRASLPHVRTELLYRLSRGGRWVHECVHVPTFYLLSA